MIRWHPYHTQVMLSPLVNPWKRENIKRLQYLYACQTSYRIRFSRQKSQNSHKNVQLGPSKVVRSH